MTTDDLIEKWETFAKDDEAHGVDQNIPDTLRRCARELRSATDWVPVGERLPEAALGAYSDEVLAIDEFGTVGVTFWFNGDGDQHWAKNQSCGSAVTHWQPLPAPPKATA